MESGLLSRKRKHQSSESGGNFTGSNSQIYLHGLKSGHALADSFGTPNIIQSLEGKTKSIVEKEPWGCTLHQITSEVSVKDLRAKRIFPPATITDESLSAGKVDWEADVDVHKTNDGTPDVSAYGHADSGVSPPLANNWKPSRKSVDSSLIRENNVMEAGEFVTITTRVAESDQNKEAGEKNGTSFVATEVVDTQGSMSKIQSLVKSLRGRKKVFLSSSSFSCRRLLHFLTNPGADDSSNFEIVEPTLPKVQKSNNMVACKDLEIDAAPNSNKLGLPDVMQKSHEDAFNDPLKKCKQITPPYSDTYIKPNIDEAFVRICNYESNNPASSSNLQLKSCSRMKMLQTPTSFSHRRLLPFLMNVSGDNQSSKPENTSEQNESKINKKSESPTSTFPLVLTDNLLDTDESNSQLEVELHKLERESPKKDLNCLGFNGDNSRIGILKRTPRGCRGMCNCLNCTSFRLNAERSFEFSRNQMHDAEEVALELINDLTSLRNILKRKTASDSNDAVKDKEVKEACAKALYKEKVARARLVKINEDLSFLCREMEK